MKKLLVLLTIFLFTSLLVSAQVLKTVAVIAGGLSTALTSDELATVTHLTLTGTIDARDFKTMRDNMPVLAELDLSGATIVDYTGTDGTAGSGTTAYPANTIPANAFYYSALSKGKISLVSVTAPSSTMAIGNLAFLDCYGLTSFIIPPSVTTLGIQSLSGCTHLGALNIPASVTSIGDIAFVWSSGSITVDESNPNYSAVDGILFDKDKSMLIHCPTSKPGSYSIPSSVSKIKDNAFNSCRVLNSITIPSTVKSIGTYAFTWCTSLSSIYSNTSLPVNLSSSIDVFYNINKSTCTLYVPYGTSGLYRTASKWQDFTNITEASSGFSVSSNALTLGVEEGSSASLNVIANVSWSVASNQSWLTPGPLSGLNNGSITFTASHNTGINRFAKVTVSAVGAADQIITVIQEGVPVAVTPGGLSTVLSVTDLNSITNLTLTGEIDARDFKIMRDNMPLLANLDLSETLIDGYNGTEGTAGSDLIYYPQNTIPEDAFFNKKTAQGKNSLVSVILSNSTTSIGIKAFQNCSGLITITLSSALLSIQDYAFYSCISLASVDIPKEVSVIGLQSFSLCTSLTYVQIPASSSFIMYNAFVGSSGLINVDPNNPYFSDLDGLLFDKTRSMLIHCPISKSGSYIIPASVSIIWAYAFSYCSNLTTITVPSLINSIGNYAFYSCTGLSSIYANAPVPVNISSSYGVFLNANTSTCTLYVPYGTSASYRAASQWKDFNNISEPSVGFSVSAISLDFPVSGGSSIVTITANVSWTVVSNQSWLTVDPISGLNSGTITLNANENIAGYRSATVTVSSTGFSDQTITISQAGGLPPLLLSDYMDINTPVVDESVTLVTANSIKPGDGRTGYFKFMPQTTGTYTFSSTSSCDPQGILWDTRSNVLIFGLEQLKYEFYFSYNLTAGQIYYFSVNSTKGDNQQVMVNITGGELQHLWLNPNSLTLASIEGSSASVNIKANNSWNAISDQLWLSVSPALGVGNGTVTLTATENTETSRTATVTFKSGDSIDQTITVKQTRPDTPIPVEAGQLSTVLNAIDMASLTKLKLTGTIDARDFKTMRDNMPVLEDIDLSGVTIATYSGTEGTYDSNFRIYLADEIPGYAFSFKSVLKSIVLPPTIISLFSNAFNNCQNLAFINIPETVSSIGYGAFYNCQSLASVLIPPGVITIGAGAFCFCKKLTSVTLPPGVTNIGGSAFSDCTKLTSVTLPSTITEIGPGAFENDTSLTAIVIPPLVTSIEDWTFGSCTALTSVSIPSSVVSIGNRAFRGCVGLTSIDIPLSVDSINGFAFYGCTGLTTINSYAVNPPKLPYPSVFGDINTSSCSLNVSYGSNALYSAADQWKDFTHVAEMKGFRLSALNYNVSAEANTLTDEIISNVTWSANSDQTWLNITPSTFLGNATITLSCDPNLSVATRNANVTISASGVVSQIIKVTQVGVPKVIVISAGDLIVALTTEELSTITKLKIKGTIDARDFKTMRDNMPLLNEIDLIEAQVVTYTGTGGTLDSYDRFYPADAIPSNAFYNPITNKSKISLVSIKLPPHINAIGNSSFSGCTGLTAISIPSLVTDIGWSAFQNCTRLSGDISFPTSLISIRPGAFGGCIGLTSINIPSSVTLIENNAFFCSSGLFYVDEGNPNYSSYQGVLFNKLKTTLIQCPVSIKGTYFIPSSVTLIGTGSFGSCSGLTAVSIPSSVTTIDNNAFYFCSSITTLNIPSSVTNIEHDAFSGCTGLTSINIPSTVTTIKTHTFANCVNISTFNLSPTVTSIGSSAFANCNSLSLFYSYSQIPINLTSSDWVFNNVNMNSCVLYVPYGTTALYRAANIWKDFIQIIEMPQLKPSTYTLGFIAAGSSATVDLASNTAWSADSDQGWLTVSPASLNGNATLTVTVTANASPTPRTGKITISASGIESQIINVTQSGLLKAVNIAAGGLFAALSTEELNTITKLVITGTIDDRDFKTMRDNMPALVEIDLSGASVAAYTGNDGTFPTHSFYPANEIPEYSFYNSNTGVGKATLTSIKLPSTVTSIGTYSFSQCGKLMTINIPSLVTSIGDNAFSSCTKLSAVNLPSSLVSIGSSTFSFCSGLVSINIPSSVTSIGYNAFSDCSALTAITVPSSVTSLGSGAFKNCTGLTSVTLLATISSIGTETFANCTGLATIDIPFSVTSIGIMAFYGCSKLNSLNIPLSVTTIGNNAFMLCNELTSVEIPLSVISIGNYAFAVCSKLTEVIIPASVITIAQGAFAYCGGLRSVTIPSSTTSLGTVSFSYCSNLSSVYSKRATPLNLGSTPDVFSNVNKTTCILYVPYGSSSLYAAADQWKDFTHIVEPAEGFRLSAQTTTVAAAAGSTTTIDINANVEWSVRSDQLWLTVNPTSESGNKTLTFIAEANPSRSLRKAIVTVSATGFDSQTVTVTQAGSDAPLTITAGALLTIFPAADLALITKLTLTGTIDARDFKTMRDNMPLLAEIDLSGATVVSYSGIEGTEGTSNINYPSNTVPACSFFDQSKGYGKASLTSVIPPSTVTSIGYNAFFACQNLTLTTIPSSVTSIGGSAYSGCRGMTSINIPSSVISIGSGAFLIFGGTIAVEADNPNYSSIDGVLFNKTQTILIQCPSSKTGSYVIPASVTTIGNEAFGSCRGLTTVTIPSSVKEIGNRAFSDCKSLTSVDIPLSVTSIGYSAFQICENLTSLKISSFVTSIGGWAFYGCNSLLSIYSGLIIPLNLDFSSNVFGNVNKTACTLYVPYGTKTAYQAANQWKDFTHIVEMPGFTLSKTSADIARTAASTVSVELTANVVWAANSDHSWLSINHTSGTGNSTLTFTGEKNSLLSPRTATITVSATGVESQTITITQQAGVAELTLQLSVYLEGFYSGAGMMSETLRSGSYLPLSQPYNVPPWSYAGTEHVDAIPPGGVVDWVLVELRQAGTAAEALPATIVPGWPKACFVKATGAIVDLEGNYLLNIGNPEISGNLFVIIRHRNHIAIMSSSGLTISGNNYVYNFTDAITRAYGNSAGYKQISGGTFGMVCGDADGDGSISVLDFSIWATDFGKTKMYLPSDIDGDGEVSVLDFSKWATNFGIENIASLRSLDLQIKDVQPPLRYKSQVPGN